MEEGAPGEDGASRAQALVEGFEPEDATEHRLAQDPELIRGLSWGKPRPGHPEGAVGAHVSDLLRTIDAWGEEGDRRAELRFLALVHDALKFRVKDWLPRKGENHHAMRARRFAETYTDDERLLAAVELHDRPYGVWRSARRKRQEPDRAALEAILDRIPDLELFLRFIELDGSTEGKDPEPVEWVRSALQGRRGGS